MTVSVDIVMDGPTQQDAVAAAAGPPDIYAADALAAPAPLERQVRC